jgi:hypothetical protein
VDSRARTALFGLRPHWAIKGCAPQEPLHFEAMLDQSSLRGRKLIRTEQVAVLQYDSKTKASTLTSRRPMLPEHGPGHLQAFKAFIPADLTGVVVHATPSMTTARSAT